MQGRSRVGTGTNAARRAVGGQLPKHDVVAGLLALVVLRRVVGVGGGVDRRLRAGLATTERAIRRHLRRQFLQVRRARRVLLDLGDQRGGSRCGRGKEICVLIFLYVLDLFPICFLLPLRYLAARKTS